MSRADLIQGQGNSTREVSSKVSSIHTEIEPDGTLKRRHVFTIAVSLCATSFAALGLPPFLPRLLPELGDPQAHWAGFLYILPTLFTAVSAPFWGRLADRYGCKLLLIRAQLGLSLAFALAAIAQNIPMLMLGLILQGLLGGTYAASTAYLASGSSGNSLASSLVLMQAAARISLAVAPVAAGLLSTFLDVRQMYGVAALLPLAAAAMTSRLPRSRRVSPSDHGGESGDSPLKEVRSETPAKPPLTVTGYCLAEAGFVLSTVVTFPYFIPLALGASPQLPLAAAGLLFALPHVVYLAVAPLTLRLVRERAALALNAALIAVALAAVPQYLSLVWPGSTGLILLIAGRLLLGAGLSLGLAALSVIAAGLAGEHRPGRLFGRIEAFSKGGAVLAGLSASALIAGGVGMPLVLSFIVALGLVAILIRLFRKSLRIIPNLE